MVKVAVITRTKDRPIFLKRAIRSVANQTYKEYTHVIINDGGDKEAVETLVSSFSEAIRAKIKVFHRVKSSNAPDTIFNESIDRADSDFFAIHDDDDTWHADFLQNTVAHLDKNPELGAVVVRADKVVEELKGEIIVEKKTRAWMSDMRVVSLYRQCIDNQLTPIATLYKRSAYEKVGKFDDSLPVVGDWEFGIRLLAEYDVDFLDPGFALANYHHRPFVANAEGNTSFSGNDKHRYYTNLIINRYLREDISRGSLGLGYIMASLKHNQSAQIAMMKKIMPNTVVKFLKKRI